MFILYFFIFIFGLIVGSFLNVVIFRLEKGGKIICDRSKCLHCRHILEWHDLVPVFSFIFLKGKCRYCRGKISWQYPLVELGTGILFIIFFNYSLQINELTNYELISNFQFPISNFQSTLYLLFWLYISCAFIVIFVYDLKHYIIPDEIIYPAIIVTMLYLLGKFIIGDNFQFSIFNFQSISNIQYPIYNILSAFVAGLFFYSIVVITKGRGMGGGDIKLAFLMGLLLGWPVILFSVFLSFILGSVVGIFLIMLGKKKMKSVLPFGPFLIISTFVGLFWGDRIIEGYLNIIT